MDIAHREAHHRPACERDQGASAGEREEGGEARLWEGDVRSSMRHRVLVVVVGCLLVAPLSLLSPLSPGGVAPVAAAKAPPKPVVTTGSQKATSRIHPKLLRALAKAAPDKDIQVVVRIVAGTSLERYASRSFARKWIDPAGMTVAVVLAKPANVMKIAGLRGVVALQLPESLVDRPKPIGSERPALPKPTPKIVLNGGMTGPAPAGWYSTGPAIHRSQQAWAKGYTGDGVTLMSNDSGADYCHPDLLGSWAYIDDPASAYYGLPEMFDSLSSFLAANDYYAGTSLVADGVTDYADTSASVKFDLAKSGTRQAVFRPIGSVAKRTFKLPSTSKSGVYHFGSHPDQALASSAEIISRAFFKGAAKARPGERAGVLVVDEHVAGVYDTVYVDLNYDYDFRNDAPARLTRDFSSQEAACLDYDHDGLNDISGGLVYFIADGHTAIPTLDWYWGVPGSAFGNGNLVAFHVQDFFSPAGDHGMGTTSVATGRGVVAGSIFYGPEGPPIAGGKGLVVGPGKEVRTTQNGDFYSSPFIEDAFVYSGLGYDMTPGTSDDVQIVTNSWAFSNIDNDGLDFFTRLVDLIHISVGEHTSLLFANGNGGPGYGTDAPLDLPSGMGVAAASLSDTHGLFYPDIEESQIIGGDVIPFSNRGPTPLSTAGSDVLAIGAFGTGDISLNETLWGAVATAIFGGTSMATPVASGNLALVYDAFRERTGRWPTFGEAKALLMGSARNVEHDVWSQGAGLVDADAGTDLAAGLHGAVATPPDWSAGSYRGDEFPAFTHLLAQGEADSQTFTLTNDSPDPVSVSISADRFSRTGSHDYSFTTLAGADHGGFPTPDYVIRIDPDIPAGTDLVQVRVGQSRADFDPFNDGGSFSVWETDIEDWTDRNGNGRFYTDANGNGKPDVGEADAGESNSFSFDGAAGVTQQVRLGDPLDRMHDGLFISLYHFGRPTEDATHLNVEVTYWSKAPWSWVGLSAVSTTIPAHGTATFDATLTVPSTAPLGEYEGAIRIAQGSRIQTIPVTAAVASNGVGATFGGIAAQDELYDNGRVAGMGDAFWRPETGDWRFFWTDVAGSDLPTAGTHYLFVDDQWTKSTADIDTIVFGPVEDCFSNGVGCSGLLTGFPGLPSRYGPYGVDTVARSIDTNLGDGRWTFQTSSGGAREVVVAPVREGLHGVALHHVIADGSPIDEPFTTRIGLVSVDPGAIVSPPATSPVTATLSTQIALSGLTAVGFGLSAPVTGRHPVSQDAPGDPSTASFSTTVSISHAALLEVSIANSDHSSDIDLYVYGPDGSLVGASFSPTDTERVTIASPADGTYRIDVHGFDVPGGSDEFDLTIDAVQGTDVTVAGLASSLPAGGSDTFTIAWNTTGKAPGTYRGLVLLGPAEAPVSLAIPVEVTVP